MRTYIIYTYIERETEYTYSQDDRYRPENEPNLASVARKRMIFLR